MSGIYGWSTGKGGVHFHRIAEPLRVAAQHGVTVGKGQVLDDDVCQGFDTILVHMLHQETQSEAWEKLARADSHRLVFDIDDVMWAPDFEPFRNAYTPDVLHRLYRNIRLAHVVTTPSEYIAEHVCRLNPNVCVVPNTVPEYLTRLEMPNRTAPTIGYQGSASHVTDFSIETQIEIYQFLTSRVDWHVHFWGEITAEWEIDPARIHNTRWSESIRQYYYSLSMDIGIGPLSDTPFNRGKSALRAIEYAALGIPAVLTDIEPYRGWVTDGETGLLIPPYDPGVGMGAWKYALDYLAENPVIRTKIGQAARERARDWTTEANILNWVNAWNSV